MEINLEATRITALPEDAYYISDFITEDEENWLLQKVKSAPLPRWTQLSHRRLQTWPSALTQSNALLASPLPDWLRCPIIERFTELGIFKDAPHQAPNHVLVNEYQPGQGIMPHEDGAAYYPLVATVSLGAPIVFDIYQKHNQDCHGSDSAEAGEVRRDHGTDRRPHYRVLQGRRSLLITKNKMYTDLLHGIAEITRDEDLGPHSICNWELLRDKEPYQGGWYERETRTSLTYRDVLRVANMTKTLKFLGK